MRNGVISDVGVTIHVQRIGLILYNRVRLGPLVKIRVVKPGGVPVQPQLGLGQLTGVSILGGRSPTGIADFSKGAVENLGAPGVVRIGGDSGGISRSTLLRGPGRSGASAGL